MPELLNSLAGGDTPLHSLVLVPPLIVSWRGINRELACCRCQPAARYADSLLPSLPLPLQLALVSRLCFGRFAPESLNPSDR